MIFRLFESRATSLTASRPSDNAAWAPTYWGTSTVAGETITERTSLQVATVWACVNVLAENIASLPWMLYESTEDGKDRITEPALASIIHDEPNNEQTSYAFRHAVMVNALLWGNGFAEILRSGDGQVSGLIPIRAERVTLERSTSGALMYRIESSHFGEGPEYLMPEQVFHIPGLSFAGLYGTSTISALREAVGLARALEVNASAYFGNGSRPGGIIKFPGELSETGVKRVREGWERIHQGSSNSGKTAVLESGGEFQALSESNDSSQHLESRQFQVTEICRVFRVPPHMVADLTRATFSNIEHQALEFVTQTLRPWLVKWEQEANRKLLILPSERKMFTEFKVEGLLRGDLQSRYDAYATARNWGWMSVNDIRSLENLNAIEDGDIYLQPLNMVEAGQEPDPVAMPAPSGPAIDADRSVNRGRAEKRSLSARQDLQKRFLDLFTERIGIVVNKESRALLAALKKVLQSKDREELRKWMTDFFSDSHVEWTRSQVAEVMRLYVGLMMAEASTEVGSDVSQERIDQIAKDFADKWARQHVAIGENQIDAALRSAVSDDLLYEQLEIQAQDWQDKRASKASIVAAAALGSAATIAAYRDGGVTRLIWKNIGENCPFCQAMDGRTVEISQPFLRPGDTLDGDDENPDMRVQQITNHPPLHAGCNCVVTPG